MATIVNEAKNRDEIVPAKFGYIGMACTGSAEEGSRVDLRNIADGNRIRLHLKPVLHNTIGFYVGPIRVAKKELAKDTLRAQAVVQQLPPGRYAVTYFYPGRDQGGVALRADTLEVVAGRILSLGRLDADVALRPVINTVKSLRIATTEPLPDSVYAPFGSFGIDVRAISSRPVDWARE